MTMVAAPVSQCLLGDNAECTADAPCFTCADTAHAARAAAGDCPDDCRECKFASLQIGPAVGMDSRGRKIGPAGWNEQSNAWERGVPVDHCGMPFLDRNLNVMGAKAVAEHRHDIDKTMRHWNAVKAARTTGSN